MNGRNQRGEKPAGNIVSGSLLWCLEELFMIVHIPVLISLLLPLNRAGSSALYPGQPHHVWGGLLQGAVSSSGDAPDLHATSPSVAVPDFPWGNWFLGLIEMPLTWLWSWSHSADVRTLPWDYFSTNKGHIWLIQNIPCGWVTCWGILIFLLVPR